MRPSATGMVSRLPNNGGAPPDWNLSNASRTSLFEANSLAIRPGPGVVVSGSCWTRIWPYVGEVASESTETNAARLLFRYGVNTDVSENVLRNPPVSTGWSTNRRYGGCRWLSTSGSSGTSQRLLP